MLPGSGAESLLVIASFRCRHGGAFIRQFGKRLTALRMDSRAPSEFLPAAHRDIHVARIKFDRAG
jgi:hypothetical protein